MSISWPNKRLEPTRLALSVYLLSQWFSYVSDRTAQAQRSAEI